MLLRELWITALNFMKHPMVLKEYLFPASKGQALGPPNTVFLIMKMAEMTEQLKENAIAAKYRHQAQLSRQAIDQLLWNNTSEYYSSSIGTSGYNLMDIAQVLVGKYWDIISQKKVSQQTGCTQITSGVF